MMHKFGSSHISVHEVAVNDSIENNAVALM